LEAPHSNVMKILHVNEHSTVKGGAEAYLLDAIQRLENRGHTCHLAFSKDAPEFDVSSIRLQSIGQVVAPTIKEDIGKLNRFVKKTNPDLIHIHGTWNIEIIKASLRLKPCLMTSHDYRWLCPDSKFYWKRSKCTCWRLPSLACIPVSLKNKCLTLRPNLVFRNIQRIKKFSQLSSKIRAVVTPSQYVADRFSRVSYPSTKTHVIPYFCSFPPLKAPREIPKQKSISIIGRTADYKGINYFLSALGKLPKDVWGYVMGDIEGVKAEQIMAAAKTEGCQDRVKLENWSNKDGVGKLLEKTSVLIFPSILPETLGIVGLEAMSFGIPVIGSDIGGVSDWLDDGVTGYLCKPKSAEEIASYAIRILNDRELMNTMGRAGQESIKNKFLPEIHLRKLEQVYASCV
jgi:glycosyltransferase involved in cell wall biosynthesis